MASEVEKVEWLKEHLFYEWQMLQYAYVRATALPLGPDRNAYFESFAVQVRIWYDFLTDDDSRNFCAGEFVAKFECDGSKMRGKIDRLNMQVQHPGKKRPYTVIDGKFSMDDCRVLADWIVPEIKLFIKALEGPYRAIWDECERQASTRSVAEEPPMIQLTNHSDSASSSVITTYIRI